MGSRAGLLYSLVISMCALGALNVNVFATGRLCVAASKRGYFPGILANLHIAHSIPERDYYYRRLSSFPEIVVDYVAAFATQTADLRIQKEVPMSANTSSSHFLFREANKHDNNVQICNDNKRSDKLHIHNLGVI